MTHSNANNKFIRKKEKKTFINMHYIIYILYNGKSCDSMFDISYQILCLKLLQFTSSNFFLEIGTFEKITFKLFNVREVITLKLNNIFPQ